MIDRYTPNKWIRIKVEKQIWREIVSKRIKKVVDNLPFISTIDMMNYDTTCFQKKNVMDELASIRMADNCAICEECHKIVHNGLFYLNGYLDLEYEVVLCSQCYKPETRISDVADDIRIIDQ